MKNSNLDQKVVEGFGEEWSRFDQSHMSNKDSELLFNKYFSIFPWQKLPNNAVGFDLGCGSGRWSKFVANRVGKLHCIDPSIAINVAKKNLELFTNCEFYQAGVDNIPLADRSMDFGFSLGVLHHIPDTQLALIACARKLKPGAPFLLYLYYSFDNRPKWYGMVWKLSELIRSLISRLPYFGRHFFSEILAALIYFPLARIAKFAEFFSIDVRNFPLSTYRNLGYYVMRTDALDRFGTRLEQRFSRSDIYQMMENAGLEHIIFSESEPYWCAVGFSKVEY